MKANLIKSLKNNVELVDIEAGRSARANFPGVDFENAVLIINGKIAEPGTIIQEGDVVTLRQIPADLTETPWFVATFIIPFGFLIQPVQLAQKAKQEADAAARELEKMKKLSNQPDIDNTPFLRGATNTIATGKSQPFFCGRNFCTPYLFSKPFYSIAGDDGQTQYVYHILEGGFKGIVFNKFGIGDTTIYTWNDTEPQNGLFTVGAGSFASGQIEIRQDGQLFQNIPALNYKVVSNVINGEIVKNAKHEAGEPLLDFLLDSNAMDVEVCLQFPYGIYQYDDEGNRKSLEVNITLYYSFDNGQSWAGSSVEHFEKNTTHSIRKVITKTFTAAEINTMKTNGYDNILVRARTDLDNSDKKRADCYVYYYQSRLYDPLKSSSPAGVLNDGGAAGLVSCLNVEDRERNYSCLIGLKIKATKANEQKLSQINFIATAAGRTWDRVNYRWNNDFVATRNPAAIALNILTTDLHPASKFDTDEIALQDFGVFYQYCEDNDLYFDYLITQAQKKDSILQLIADVCGVAFYKDIYGRHSVAIDQVQENALAVYNPQNIIRITNKKTFSRRVDALRVKYIDSANDTYKENTYTVGRFYPVILNENSIIKEVTATGITRHAQIVKYARRLMAIDELRPMTTTLQIGAEGVYFTPFAKITIQDPSLNSGQDSIIKSVTYVGGILTKITLTQPVTFYNSNARHGVVINTTNLNVSRALALEVSGVGTTDELAVVTLHTSGAAAQPAAGDVVSFGELDNEGKFTDITHDFVITRISRNKEGFSLDLQEYNESIYNPGVIPAYKPLVNNTPVASEAEIPIDAVTREELDSKVNHVNSDAVQAAVDTITNGHRFTSVYQIRPVTSSLEEVIQKIDEEAQNRAASISISEEEILIQVNDTRRALIGLIDVQAGYVTALVQGGGATGQLSLSLELPAVITPQQRGDLISVSSVGKVNAVYGLIEKTTNFGIKASATSTQIKALWDDAVTGGFLASQLDLSATQVHIAAENVVITSGSEAGVTLIEGGKIRTELIDASQIKATEGFFENVTITGNLKSRGIKSDGGTFYHSIQEHYYPAIDGWYRFFDNIRTVYELKRNPADQNFTINNMLCHLNVAFTYNGNRYKGATTDIKTEIFNDNPLKMYLFTGKIMCWNEGQAVAAMVEIVGFFDKANRTDSSQTYWQFYINGVAWKALNLETLDMDITLEY